MAPQNTTKDKLRLEREARLAAELRGNLRKRKQQARQRRDHEDSAIDNPLPPKNGGQDE